VLTRDNNETGLMPSWNNVVIVLVDFFVSVCMPIAERYTIHIPICILIDCNTTRTKFVELDVSARTDRIVFGNSIGWTVPSCVKDLH
jgi:hypothetical protein